MVKTKIVRHRVFEINTKTGKETLIGDGEDVLPIIEGNYTIHYDADPPYIEFEDGTILGFGKENRLVIEKTTVESYSYVES